MLHTFLLALLAAVVNADYLQVAQFGSAGCAGSPITRNAQMIMGCVSAGSGFYRALSCTNSTWGVSNIYSTSTCTGAIAGSSVINGFNWGCTSSGSQSSEGTCVTGTWSAPAASLVVINYPASPACPQTTTADNAVSYSTSSCLAFGTTSARAACTSSSYTLTSFTSTDCSGTGTQTSAGSTGCALATGGGQGVSVYQCTTSGASSTSFAFASIALMLVVAASTAAV